MKLTKKIEQEILKVYNTGWDAYMRGDLKAHAACLSSDFKIIGTTESEQFSSKKAWLAFCKKTIHQVVGVAQMRNRKIKLEAVGDGVMVVENSAIYVLIDGTWQFYSKLRITALMRKEKSGWKYVHQHGSLPDTRASEDETIATKQIKKENQQLREAVKRRTIELEEKTRELEIESSLEKVRAQALGMRTSEDLLDICRTLYKELGTLGITSLRNAVIHVFHDERECFTDYEYSDSTGGNITTIPYRGDVTVEKFVKRIRKSENAFVELKVEGQEFANWKSFRKKTGQIKDARLNQTKAIQYYIYSVGHASIGISAFDVIEKDKKELLKRFRNVFDFAYRRYTDITLAQTQAREAQIEAGLERVRSRSLAMHKTAELQRVIHTVHQELLNLNIAISGGSFIVINSELDTELHCWGSGGTADTSDEIRIPYFSRPFYTNILKRIKRGPGFFTEEYTQQEKKEFFTFLFKYEPWSKLGAKEKKDTLAAPGGYTRSCSVSQHTSIFIINHFGEKFTNADNEILRRFGKVFEQAYTRFLDLQKAEAQAREAQIEAALERVRGKAMAMHSSNDLAVTVDSFFTELNMLRVNPHRCGVTLIEAETRQANLTFTTATSDGNFKKVTGVLKLTGHPVLSGVYDHWKLQKEYHPVLYGAEIKEYYKAMNPQIMVPDFADDITQFGYYFFFKEGGVYAWTGKELVEEDLQIFRRFTSVLSLTYRRYMDLKEAEAQAREAQIEAALERVRAQTMAMHSSEDVGKCVVKMFSELTALGVDEGTRFGIGILNHDNESNQLWTARKNGEEVNMHIGNIDMTLHPLLKSVRKAWKAQVPLHRYVLEGEDLLNYYQMLNNAPDYKIQIPIEKLPKKEIQNCFIFEHGFFYAFSPHEFHPDLIHNTQRFSALFEQTYRRYLDLVKAEAQAREAEIELALERVRARTMAMHHTEELKEVIQVVFDQFVGLNINVEHAGFILDYKEREDMHIWLADHQQGVPTEITIPYFDSPHWNSYLEAKAKQESFFANLLPFEVKNKFYQDIFEWIPELTEEAQQYILSKPALAISTVLLDNVGLYIEHYSETPFSAEENAILMRFGKVFQQTYTRFLDLQKAESQAREAQIEAALEKVRSRSLAMHNSSELNEVVKVLFEKLTELQVPSTAVGIQTFIEGSNDMQAFVCGDVGTGIVINQYRLPYFDHPIVHDYLNAHKDKLEVFVGNYSKKEKDSFYDVIVKLPELKDLAAEVKTMIYNSDFYEVTIVPAEKSLIAVNDFQGNPLTESQVNILKRFAKVFDQTYTRFLDLQKAEAQAREAQIELSLERIRAKVTAMRESVDLLDIVVTLRTEFVNLNHRADYFWHMRWLPDKYEKAMTSGDGTRIGMIMTLPRNMHGDIKRVADWEKGNQPSLVLAMDVDTAVEYIDKMIRLGDFKQVDPQAPSLDDIRHIGGLTFVMARTTHGEIGYSLPGVVTEPPIDAVHTLIRFAGVFDLAYKRFEDLKAAEKRHREAQIELALERVRAQSMAMHRSDELQKVVNTIITQLNELKVEIDTTQIVTMHAPYENMDIWTAMNSNPQDISESWSLPYGEVKVLRELHACYESGADLFHQSFKADDKNEFYQYVFSYTDFVKLNDERKKFIQNAPLATLMTAFVNQIAIQLISYSRERFSEEEEDTLKRFTRVFSQSHTRFLDLQKAEAQAREAQIEAALERVRSRTMGMQSSEELPEVANLLFTEVRALGIHAWSCGYNILAEDKKSATCWMSSEGTLQTPFQLRLWGEASFDEMGDFIHSENTMLVQELGGQALDEHYAHMKSFPDLKPTFDEIDKLGLSLPTYQINHLCKFTQGFLLFITYEKVPDAYDIFKRFTKVFEQTYTRFLDLKKAEAQATEATRQASLDRVRGEIASMRTTDDLQRITPVVWRELITLGVPFFRCGVFIINEHEQRIHAYLSTPEGKSLAVLHLPFDSNDTNRNAVAHWREQKVYTDHWDQQQFQSWAKAMMEQQQIEGEQQYQAGDAPPESLCLQFIPFKQGMLYVGSSEPLAEDQINLVQSLADAFAVAYARYEDFKQLEDAKTRVEATLTELKATQSQLVQSEKMASLGELTAGIAHEIQNPLNFVNNFSEVSNELLDEMKEEIDKGNYDEVKAITDDVKQNLEKILHHGKRADGIVKGMLQHSRSSSGVKEHTDINALADEYLRLAYHGLRAKDKSFNAKFETHFDESIEKVEMVPQDIGRVILNLITNAFYVVAEKKKQNPEGYEPTVIVSSRKVDGKVEVSVKDNGSGIPDSIKEKIFQPFFTTKPTGQGTGLGLSLSYDIVKAHGGRISVESEEGNGTEFILQIPLS